MRRAYECFAPVSFHQTEGGRVDLLPQALHCVFVMFLQIIRLAITLHSHQDPPCVLVDQSTGNQIVVFVPTTKIKRLPF